MVWELNISWSKNAYKRYWSICSISELFRRCFVHFTIDNTINVLNSFDLLIWKTKTTFNYNHNCVQINHYLIRKILRKILIWIYEFKDPNSIYVTCFLSTNYNLWLGFYICSKFFCSMCFNGKKPNFKISGYEFSTCVLCIWFAIKVTILDNHTEMLFFSCTKMYWLVKS